MADADHATTAQAQNSCGLRCNEVLNLQLTQIDFDRKQLHVVQSKGNKDRILPLSEHLIRGMRRYIEASRPRTHLFEGNGCMSRQNGSDSINSRYSHRGIQWAISNIAKQAGIKKAVHTHTLRHSYACHLLEDGMNIVTLQELLGHSCIETTMEYLKLTQLDNRKMFSPLDSLFAQCAKRK